MRTRNAFLLLNLVSFVYSNLSEVYEDFLSKPQYQLYFSEEKWSEKIVTSKTNLGNTIIKLPINKEGITYACEIEKPIIAKKNLTQEENEQLKVDKALEQLEPLKNGPCINYVQEWWSYEFCYKKHITQYHRAKENDPPEYEMEYFLGKYPDQEVIDNPDSKYEKETYNFGPLGKNYISQMLVDGTTCDITNTPRKTEIRYYCAESEGIVAVKEVTTCTYLVMFNTPRICNGPGFESKKSINSILCHPIKDVEDDLNPDQPEDLPFPIFYKRRSVAQIEKAKAKPQKIFRSKYSKKKGTKVVSGPNKKEKRIYAKNSLNGESNSIYNYENNEDQRKDSSEDSELKKKRNEFINALLPYATELKGIDEDIIDEVLTQLADTLVEAIDKDEGKAKGKENGADENSAEGDDPEAARKKKLEKAKTLVDIEVVDKEKLKSWIENNEDNLATDDVKLQVVLLDENGNKREMSSSETSIDDIMEFLKQFGTDALADNVSVIKKLKDEKVKEDVEEVGEDKQDSTKEDQKERKDKLKEEL